MNKDIRIVYMGTPDFAVESLRKLVEGGYNVVGVVTMPDKAVGRHHTQLQPSAVKIYAMEQGIPVLQPEKLKDPEFLEALRALNADLQIVVAFRMLPEVVWDMPRLGTFNLHAALLPQYRGAAPINWAVMNGETQSGVTTFFLDKDIDTGVIIHQTPVEIKLTDDAGDLHDKLMYVGADLVVKTVDDIIAGNIAPRPQSEWITADTVLHHAPKIFKETCRIPWAEKSMKEVYDHIRGLSPYPAAWTELITSKGPSVLKIYRTEMELTTPTEAPGTVVVEAPSTFKVATKEGYLHILSLQIAGKKRMEVSEFLRGFHAQDDLRVE